MKTYKTDREILGRELNRPVTVESYRGLLILGKEINKEIGAYLRNYSQWKGDKKISSYINTLTNLWREIQIIGYSTSEAVVKEAFATATI